jgi:menaquinol-cytochrome c reductase iron-sulfur subunit
VRVPEEEKSVSRRNFLKYSIYGVGGLIFAALAAPLARYFFAPALSAPPQAQWIAVARTGDIPVGTPTRVEYEERQNDSWAVITLAKSAWIVTEDGQSFTVFDPHCTHLGCPYTWVAGGGSNEGRFECPCHGGVFAIDGTVVSGPPPRPLDRLENRVEGNSIEVRGIATKGEA